MGGAYGKDDGLIELLSLAIPNFRGTGDKVNVHWEFGGDAGNNNYEFSYTRP